MNPTPPSSVSPLLRFAFYGFAIGMALVHVFITFRGLSSPQGMEHAQMAREIARGNFFQTKVIRPYAWAVLEVGGKDPNPAAMIDITQPPLQPLLWAPLFKALERHQPYEPTKNGGIYLLDRAIACVGVTGLLLTLLWSHGAARKLFDESVAAISVLALMVCEPLWELAVSGSPVALLLPLVALAFRLLVSVSNAVEEERPTGLRLLALALTATAMILTHWLAIWLVMGLIAAVVIGLPGKRAGAILVALFPLLALAGLGFWMMQRCGDPLGGAKTIFQAQLMSLDPSLLQREFSTVTQPIQLDDLLRKLALNWQTQLGDLYSHLGYCFPAFFFFAALLHRFRNPEAASIQLGLGAWLLFVILGMGFIGLPEGREDDNHFYLLLMPAMCSYGVAMLAVLWARLKPPGGPIWSRWGFAILAVALSMVPMVTELPAQLKMGLTLRNRIFPHWPPYVPDRVSLVRKLVEPDEIVFSDAPWFVAWYANTPAAWIPVKRDAFTAMRERAKLKDTRVAGFVITPHSARVNYLHEAFTGPYREWPDLLFRGLILAFDKEFLPRADFEYKVPLPLVAVPVGAKENLSLQMTFYTDKPRTLKE